MEESIGIKNLVEDSKPIPEPSTNINLNSKSTIEWLRKSNINYFGKEEINFRILKILYNENKLLLQLSYLGFARTAKIQYLNNPTQLHQHKAIESVFKKLDEDGSNSLDIDEVNKMFRNNNISITIDQLKSLFSIACKSGSFELSFDEFKQFTLSDKANRMFRDIMKAIRQNEQYKHPEERADLLPYNFSTLLNFLSEKEKKEMIREEIFKEEKECNITEAMEDIKRFLILFKMANRSSDADETDFKISNQIKAALEYKRQRKEMKKEGKQSGKSKMEEVRK